MKTTQPAHKILTFSLALKSTVMLVSVIVFSLCAQSGFSKRNFSFTYFVDTSNANSCCESIYKRSQFDSIAIEELGLEFQRLKDLNCQDCRNFGSDLYEIMEVLRQRLSGKSEREIKNVMGQPDKKENGCLIYCWRGSHDYLIFDFSGGNGAVVDWYYAYE